MYPECLIFVVFSYKQLCLKKGLSNIIEKLDFIERYGNNEYNIKQNCIFKMDLARNQNKQ